MAITRNLGDDTAKQLKTLGIEVVQAKASLLSAFKDTWGLFAVTFTDHVHRKPFLAACWVTRRVTSSTASCL